jgi:hypothetical protein
MGEILTADSRRDFLQGIAAAVAGAALSSSTLRSAEALPIEVGQWSQKYGWPCVAIHLHFLRNGKILSWQDDDVPGLVDRNADFSKAFVSSIPPNGAPSGTHVYVPNNLTNLFCSGHTFLPDGRLLALGGHEGANYYGSTDVNIFEIHQQAPIYTWARQNGYPMTGGRWYPSVLTLASGEVLVLGGTTTAYNTFNIMPQVWKTNAGGGWRDLSSALLRLDNYPKIYQLTNGLVFQVGCEQLTRFLDTEANAGKGRWTNGPKRNYGSRYYGMSVMYDDDKILVAGGAPSGTLPTKTAETIDAGVAGSGWKFTGKMAYGRRHGNATVLPDGTVLVTGGTSASGFNDGSGAVFAAEMWNPATGQWTTMASAQVARIYHSTAMLLPDGRVLSAGGGRPKPNNGGTDNTNVEIYSPPYMFKPGRPTIGAVMPANVGYGQTITLPTPDAPQIGTVALHRLPSVTHTCDFNQRRKVLGFTVAGAALQVRMPTSRLQLPPAHYMLFIVSKQGVPSVANIIKVG